MSQRILLVEDDRALRGTLRDALILDGYQVITAASLSEASAILQQTQLPQWPEEQKLHLLLLDLGLPDGSGADLLREASRQQGMAVLVISAQDDEQQKIALLDSGADDYLVKPFSVGEMLARIRVALRHLGRQPPERSGIYTQPGLWVDLKAQQISRNGQPVHLTPTEFKLLARLIRSNGQVVTHRQLLMDVWGPSYLGHTHYLRLYMGQLRAKLEDNPSMPAWLFTEPGIGYRCLESAAPPGA